MPWLQGGCVKSGWQVVRLWTHYLPTGLDDDDDDDDKDYYYYYYYYYYYLPPYDVRELH